MEALDTRRLEPLAPAHRENIVKGSLWMVGISIALFFLPVVNGLIGGFVGGYKVGSTGRAIVAAILPGFIAGAALWGLMSVFDHPVMGLFSGIAASLWIALANLGVLIGAAVGGAVASSKSSAYR